MPARPPTPLHRAIDCLSRSLAPPAGLHLTPKGGSSRRPDLRCQPDVHGLDNPALGAVQRRVAHTAPPAERPPPRVPAPCPTPRPPEAQVWPRKKREPLTLPVPRRTSEVWPRGHPLPLRRPPSLLLAKQSGRRLRKLIIPHLREQARGQPVPRPPRRLRARPNGPRPRRSRLGDVDGSQSLGQSRSGSFVSQEQGVSFRQIWRHHPQQTPRPVRP
jgi:hypothetical protein